MIKLFFHRYHLSPQVSLNSVAGKAQRDGALIKVKWPDEKFGYADLFPWPELGDVTLDEHLEELHRGHLTSLMEQSIWLARKDANSRAAKKTLLQDGQKMKNHFTIPDFTAITSQKLIELKSAGFSTLKVKVGRDCEAETEWIKKVLSQQDFGMRLDFNAHGTFSSFEKMMSSLSVGLRQRIEFVEDPMPYDAGSWAEASKLSPLALDQEGNGPNKVMWNSMPGTLPFSYLIIKPARQDVETAVKHALVMNLKMVFTSSMDHSLGVIHALAVASEYKGKYPNLVMDSGCMTTQLYVANEFSAQTIIQGPYITQVPGFGVGFDDILGAIPWIPVN